MIDLLIEAVGASSTLPAAVFVARRWNQSRRHRRRRASQVAIDRLERELFPHLFPDPPRPSPVAFKRSMEAALFGMQPGAVWPVESSNYVQVFNHAISASAARGAARGLLHSGEATRLRQGLHEAWDLYKDPTPRRLA